MKYSSISVSKEIKNKLERAKRNLEIKLGRSLSWDEFFERILSEEKSEYLITEEEAKILLKLIEEGRKSWRERYA
jgi:replicative superfamily II helicase